MADCEHRDDYGSTIVGTGPMCLLCGKEVQEPPTIDAERLAKAIEVFGYEQPYAKVMAEAVAAAYKEAERHG